VGSDQTVTVSTLTTYPASDSDFYSIHAGETDSTCGCGFGTDEDYQFTVTLTAPAGSGDYTFCSSGSCATLGSFCQTVAAGSSQSWQYNIDGACGGGGTDEYDIFVSVNGPTECSPYSLSYTFDAGFCF
jgi:hypothetical protein